MMQPTWRDRMLDRWWGLLAWLVPPRWGPGHVRHWRSGEPLTWQGRVWLKVLARAYYYGELVDGRIPEPWPTRAQGGTA